MNMKKARSITILHGSNEKEVFFAITYKNRSFNYERLLQK